MHITKKRDLLGDYCYKTGCDNCKLAGRDWETPIEAHNCPDFTLSSESELDKALKIIGIENDPVNRPTHYTDGKIEVIDYIEDKKLGFCLGNAIKYISRAGKKDKSKEVEDLKKAIWYIERKIKQLEEGLE